MSHFLIVVATLLAVLPASALSVDAGTSETPITKVINLLKEMQEQLVEDQKKDVEIYDAMVCWCETNDKVKTKAIKDAEARLAVLETSIEELTASSAQLKTDIETTTSEITANEKALQTATSIRENEHGEFTEEKEDSVQMLGGLAGAVQALGKHHSTPGAELEKPEEAKEDTKPTVFLQTRLSKSVRGSVVQPVAAASYSSQSGAIFGILRNMKDEMEIDLTKSQKREAAAAVSHEKMASSKSEELSAGRQQLAEKRQELADTDENLANDRAEQKDTSAVLETDRVFLADLKVRCGKMDQQWGERSKMRTEETQAVSDAIAILSDDDAKDLAQKTVGSSFLQIASASIAVVQRSQAAAILRKTAITVQKPALGDLANMLKSIGLLKKITESITSMVAQLKKEQQEEVQQKDYCKGELQSNEVELDASYGTKEDLEGKKEDLNNLLQELTAKIQQAKDDTHEQQVELKKAVENRGKQNLAFQIEVRDQRMMQVVLQKALDKLKAFYGKKAESSSLLQQAPPAGFKPYKKAGGSGGVVGFLMNIIGESVNTEKEARAAEQEAQTAYEEFVGTSNALLKALATSLSDMSAQKAQADQEFVAAKESLGTTYKTIMSLSDINTGLHKECDYVLKNFEERQDKRLQEIEGLTQAEQVLAGASFK